MIWKRLFLVELWKSFLFILLCFFVFYVLVDYSSRISKFPLIRFEFNILARYYGCVFVRRLEILVPFALLLANIKTLTARNQNNELIPLLASGVPMKTLMKPHLYSGFIAVVFLFFSAQYITPYAMEKLSLIEESCFFRKTKKEPRNIHMVHLEDKSLLIFQNRDRERDLLFDTYWVRTGDDLYHFKILDLSKQVPEGHFGEHLVRAESGALILEETFAGISLVELPVKKTSLEKSLKPIEGYSLTELFQELPLRSETASNLQIAITTMFYRKLAMPWLSFLAILAPAPFCLRFNRNLAVFLLYIGSIAGLLVAFFILNASTVLSLSQMLPAPAALLTPMVIFLGISSWIYTKGTRL